MKKKKPLKLSRMTVTKLSTAELAQAKGGTYVLEGGGGGGGNYSGTCYSNACTPYTSQSYSGACAYSSKCVV